MADEEFCVADLRAAAKVLALHDGLREEVDQMKQILAVTMKEVAAVAAIFGAEIGYMKERAQALVDELVQTKAQLEQTKGELTEALRP